MTPASRSILDRERQLANCLRCLTREAFDLGSRLAEICGSPGQYQGNGGTH